jgi:hypothetical protein
MWSSYIKNVQIFLGMDFQDIGYELFTLPVITKNVYNFVIDF